MKKSFTILVDPPYPCKKRVSPQPQSRRGSRFIFPNHKKPPRTSTFAAVCEMFRIAAPAAHHIFPLMDPLPPLAEQLLGAEINKIPHTLVCGILVREAGLEPARPEWTLEPESSESANSTTRAFAVFRLLRYIITDPRACQADFSFLRLFFAFFLPRNAALPRAPLHEPHISCREGTDNEPVRSRIHAHSVDLDEEISKIGSLLAKTADFGRGTRT